jgi:hypothetical protein
MVNIELTVGLDKDFTGTLLDANGNAISITAGSDIIFKVYRGSPATPDLDVSGTALAHGTVTSFTANTGNWAIKFFGLDTAALVTGAYDIKVILVDAGDGNREKDVDFGVLYVLGGVAGKTT